VFRDTTTVLYHSRYRNNNIMLFTVLFLSVLKKNSERDRYRFRRGKKTRNNITSYMVLIRFTKCENVIKWLYLRRYSGYIIVHNIVKTHGNKNPLYRPPNITKPSPPDPDAGHVCLYSLRTLVDDSKLQSSLFVVVLELNL